MKMRAPAFLVFGLTALTLLGPGAAHATPFFTGIGFIPGENQSRVYGISADGSVLTGMSGPTISGTPMVWTGVDGIVPISGGGGAAAENFASAASADGSVIVGQSGGRAFSWTLALGLVDLGVLPGAFESAATGISADGSIMVGYSGVDAFYWTDADGLVSLGGIPGEAETRALGISANGSVIVGSSGTEGGGGFAIMWQEFGEWQPLGSLGDALGDFASAASDDGSVIVGQSAGQAFRWTSDGMVGLGFMDGATDSAAMAVSADGSVILGYSGSSLFLWDPLLGMRDLHEVLMSDFGLDLSGWTLTDAYALSGDGRMVAGWGINPQGQVEGWVAGMYAATPIPEPHTLALVLAGILGLGIRAMRRPLAQRLADERAASGAALRTAHSLAQEPVGHS